MMFTVYHAVAFVAIFIFGLAIGYAIGKSDGRDEMCREIDEYYRAKRQRRAVR